MRDFAVAVVSQASSQALDRVVHAAVRSMPPPAELYIAELGRRSVTPRDLARSVVGIRVTDPSGFAPVAQARNRIVERSMAEVVVFVGSRCIPSPRAAFELATAAAWTGGVVMGDVRLLPRMSLHQSWRNDVFETRSQVHASRHAVHAMHTVPEPKAFRSHLFAVRRDVYERIGGYDDDYVGYGGEDLDFALRAERAGIERFVHPARGWQQAGSLEEPPSEHLASIVRNARRFHQRWGEWPMQAWLSAFAAQERIRWVPEAGDVALLASPSGRP